MRYVAEFSTVCRSFVRTTVDPFHAEIARCDAASDGRSRSMDPNHRDPCEVPERRDIRKQHAVDTIEEPADLIEPGLPREEHRTPDGEMKKPPREIFEALWV